MKKYKTKLNFSKAQKIFLIVLWVGVFGLGLIIFLLDKFAPGLVFPFIVFIIFAGAMLYNKAIGKPVFIGDDYTTITADDHFKYIHDPTNVIWQIGEDDD
jgi:hypothetical protein